MTAMLRAAAARRAILFIVPLAVAGLLIGLYLSGVLLGGRAAQYSGTVLDAGPAPDFGLVDQRGQPFQLSETRGKVVALVFLDSRCVDTCPLTAQELRRAYWLLGKDAEQVAFVGVNVNTGAARVEDVRSFTEQQHLDEIPAWRFVTGAPAELDAVRQQYFIYAAADQSGSVVHNEGLYLIDRLGRLRWFTSETTANAELHFSLSDALTRQIAGLLRERS